MGIIDAKNSHEWNSIIDSFPESDIYYRCEYTASLLANNKRGALLVFDGAESRICMPVIINDIANDPKFVGLIPNGAFFDMETPYGYGGPLFDGYCERDLLTFKKELLGWCGRERIVSLFIRFHPLLKNAVTSEKLFDEVTYAHKTIFIDTTDNNLIMQNASVKCRSTIRIAERKGVSVCFDEKLENAKAFKSIYESVMDLHNADESYYFPQSYYDFLRNDFSRNTILITAQYENKTIAGGLFFYDENTMHYHLSGSLKEYRGLSATNLILYKAACWANKKGLKALHLGGGMSENDSLFAFKKSFNKNGEVDFYIGKSVFLPEKYNELIDIRGKGTPLFDRNNSRLIQYRA